MSPNLTSTALADLGKWTGKDDGPLYTAVMNSTSVIEAGFALGLVTRKAPERVLVACLNMREILRELPVSPFPMPMDFDSLAKSAGLKRRGYSWIRSVGKRSDASEIELLGQGNLCYDMAVRTGKASSLLKPGPVRDDFIRPKALEIILSQPELLFALTRLVHDMGHVHDPRFYMSIQDWQMEHAAESFDGMTDIF